MPAIGSSLRRRPRWTLRLRLTLLYGGLFLVAGAVLLAVTYELVARSPEVNGQVTLRTKVGSGEFAFVRRDGPLPAVAVPANVPPQVRATAIQLKDQAQNLIARQRQAQLDALLARSGIALGIMAVVSIGLGWVMAGRALRPVRTMTHRARGISERNLHERLAVEGPDDELKELGDTFDGLLGRLETAFESQRRFVANASHELRTPITLERALVEVALADPHPTVQSLRETCERVLAAGEQQARLIEALLTLARSQRGLGVRQEVDLAVISREAIGGVDAGDVVLEAQLEPALTPGDPALLERLVANLVDNGVRYNRAGGTVQVRTGIRGEQPCLTVTNTGQAIAPHQVPPLLEPFRRLDGERTGQPAGLGLGLSIVSAIAEVHGAALRIAPQAGGGLEVDLRFPRLAVAAGSAHREADLVTLPSAGR